MAKKGLIAKVGWPLVAGLTMLFLGVSYADDTCRPSISGLTPNLGPSWMTVSIDGERFGSEPLTGDGVFVGPKNAPIYYWSDTLIKFKLPVGLPPGTYSVSVKKAANPLTGCGEQTSNQLPFEVTSYPKISTIYPIESTCGQQLDIFGQGFRLKEEEINESGFGYSTYVELHASADRYRITEYPDRWFTPDHIKVRLENLFDVSSGLEVPDWQLYHGIWTLKVITDYFIDNGDGRHNLGLNGLDTEDEILYRAMSNPVGLRVTQCQKSRPIIYYLDPVAAPASRGGAPSKAVIKGLKFGEVQGESEFHIGGRTWYEGHPKIRLWCDNKIKFKVPAYEAPFPKFKQVWLTVDGIDSNRMTLTILEP